ncbi:MAG TPA: T9SS type A sorting domain-containing protein [Bacteroidales bacterium]|nr:T9SS type A sorting domain-containing protein [Bacteroidales bacterium]
MKTIQRSLLLIIQLCIVSTICAAVPTGYYYFARGKKQAELKTTLHQISSPLMVLEYGSGEGATWQGFYSTDRNADNTVKDIYSPIVRQFNKYNSISDMAIEHSFPKSWWGGHVNNAYKDLFHLYPADSRTNSAKSNHPLGKVKYDIWFYNQVSTIGNNTFGTEYTGACFEPADEYKGDFARSYFYISTIYEDLYPLWNSPMLTNTRYPAWKSWAIDLLLKWHEDDPVSPKEQDRNDSIYAIQGNRNPFIDHPELADYIWGDKQDEPFTYPAETGAFIISPRRKFSVDFGAVFQNNTKQQSVLLQGVNISSSLSLSFTNTKSCFSVSSNSVSAEQALAGYNLVIQASPNTAGVILDTLIISNGGLQEETRIPLKIVATSEFITTEPTDITPVGATLHWLEDPAASDYKVSLYQGNENAGDLIISGYYEGASNDKAIELYNGTGKTVDLSKYSLKKQSNGDGKFVATYYLSGNLPNNKTCLVVYQPPTSQTPVNDALKSKADLFTDSICAFNGNDALALFRNGIQIDVVGKIDGGADYKWGENKILKRKSNITHPSNHFDLADWDEFPYEQFEKMGAHSMNLSGISNYIFKDKSAGSINKMEVAELLPGTQYTYSVTSVRNDEQIPSVNTQSFKTEGLEAPIAQDATDVFTTSFMANWEETSYATSYLLDVFQLQGSGFTQIKETFDNVTSSGGSLPEGWTGKVSGSYTSTASSGDNPPSVGFKNDKEWLKTKTFSSNIIELKFMYRFPSSGVGSYMIVEAENSKGWDKIDSITYVNTSKYYPIYSFASDKEYRTIRFTYNKSTGNFALDDVEITYGNVDTVYMLKNQAVESVSYFVDGLTEDNIYYYRVRAINGDVVSGYSDIIEVNTIRSSTQNQNNSTYRYVLTDRGVNILDLQGNETIRVYSVTGILLYNNIISNSDAVSIPLDGKGIYIIQISKKGLSEVRKIIK